MIYRLHQRYDRLREPWRMLLAMMLILTPMLLLNFGSHLGGKYNIICDLLAGCEIILVFVTRYWYLYWN